MKERITYFLGAGFSAPLGLPVMNNFLIKSKDLYFSNPSRYSHFEPVLESIEKLSLAKYFYETDLFNIEEILSIIEMGSFLAGNQLKEEFKKYLIDVIEAYTPHLNPYPKEWPANRYDVMFGGQHIHSHYGIFVANLFCLEFFEKQVKDFNKTYREFHFEIRKDSPYNYDVITLNYDLVLEEVCDFLNESFISKNKIKFNQGEISPTDNSAASLCKLHGSVGTRLIVPPTWSKGNNPEIMPIWRNAYQVLSNSNYIRFIGYSLPIADSYVKYLLKSAVLNSKHLKNIDVICLDKDGEVESRYADFIKYVNYRFKKASVSDYLSGINASFLKRERESTGRKGFRHIVDDVEKIYNLFMVSNSNLILPI